MKKSKQIIFLAVLFFASLSIGKIGLECMSGKDSAVQAQTPKKVYEKTQQKYLAFNTLHTKCNHTTSYTDNKPTEFTSNDELLSQFPSWEISGGDENTIILSRTEDDFCEEHYVATIADNQVTVLSRNNGSVLCEFFVDLDFLSDKDIANLKQGLFIDGKEKLTSFIEDFTS